MYPDPFQTDDYALTRAVFPWQRRTWLHTLASFAWLTSAAYVWSAGFQHLAATAPHLRTCWQVAGFLVPPVILLVFALPRVPGRRLALPALSLLCIHLFAANLLVLTAWRALGVNPDVVTPESMLVEAAVVVLAATPLVLGEGPYVPLAGALFVLAARRLEPRRREASLALAAFALWGILACNAFWPSPIAEKPFHPPEVAPADLA